jgi:hypothetical protein
VSADHLATPDPQHAPGDWSQPRRCPICWDTFSPVQPRHTYCSDRCRKAAHQRRQAGQPAAGTGTREQPEPATPAPIAERDCPHCGETITIVALLTTAEVARPAVPGTTTNAVIPLHRKDR